MTAGDRESFAIALLMMETKRAQASRVPAEFAVAALVINQSPLECLSGRTATDVRTTGVACSPRVPLSARVRAVAVHTFRTLTMDGRLTARLQSSADDSTSSCLTGPPRRELPHDSSSRDSTDDDQNDSGHLKIDPRRFSVYGPRQNRADGDQENAETDSHLCSPFSRGRSGIPSR